MQQFEPFSIRAKVLTYTRPMTAKELADCLGKNEHTIRSLARRDVIPSFRLGTSVLFEPKAIVEWYDEQKHSN
jgi:excisionase family DNA binding protein